MVISDTERFAGYHTEDHRDDSAQVTQVASSVGSLGGSVSLTAMGYATSTEQYRGSSQASQGSTISGGGNASLTTTQGDLHAVQGNLKAGDTLSLDSARDLVLEAGNSSSSEHSKGSNAGVEAGVGASVGAQTGVYVYAQASVGRHKSDAESTTWHNTQLTGQTISLTSQGDTTLRGAVAKADRIDVQTGGVIQNGGVNKIPKTFDSRTGLSGKN